MTVKDLFEHVPERTDIGKVSVLEQGRCGHCGEKNDFHQQSYFCKRCYFWMHLGDTTTLHGLAHDFSDIYAGNVNSRYYEIEKVDKPIINESKEIIDENQKTKDKKRTF